MKGFLTEDPRQRTYFEKVPWISFLFLTAVFFIVQHDWLISLSAGEGFGIGLDDFTARVDEGSMLRRIVFIAMGVYALVSLVRTRYRPKVESAIGWLMLLFATWSVLSLGWSDNFDISFRRVVLFLILLISAIALSQRFFLRDIVLWIFFSTLIYLNIGLAVELALGTFHPLGGGYRFAGTLHPNSQGINCALLLFASFFLLIGQKRWRWILIAIFCESLIFLFLTKSRTSLGFTLLTFLIYFFMKGSLSRKGVVVLSAIFVACILLLINENFYPIFRHAIALDRKDAETITLTGRIPLWGQLLPYIAKRPAQGYGYDGFWTPRHIAEIARGQNWVVNQGHSVYLDLSLGLGIIGAMIYFLMLVGGIGRTLAYQKSSGNDEYSFLLVVLIFIALNGLLESIVIASNQMSFITLIIIASLGFSSQPRVRPV